MIKPRTTMAIYFGLAILVGLGCSLEVEDSGREGDALGDIQSSLSSTESDGLVFTREEEKLARDVYATLEQYDSSFSNIRKSKGSAPALELTQGSRPNLRNAVNRALALVGGTLNTVNLFRPEILRKASKQPFTGFIAKMAGMGIAVTAGNRIVLRQ